MRLLLLRHAKSAWDTDVPTDHERPLSKRGRRDAPRIGQILRERGWVPDIVLCSTARRTVETWERMGPHLAPESDVQHLPDLYHAGVRSIAPILSAQEAQTVLVLGHNPGIEDMLLYLSGENHRITTCNVALLESDASRWSEAISRPWRLVDLIRPRAPK